MASIRKRGERQWEARVRRRGYPVTCKTFDTKAEAEAWARDVESEMDKGVFVTRKEAEATTLKELLQRYLDEHVPLLADPVREGNRVKALQRRPLALRFMASIRSMDIASFVKEREQEGAGGNVIRLDLAVLSRLFNVAKANWGMESLSNPVSRITRPKTPSGRVRRLEDGEWDALMAVASPVFALVMQFAVATAMRREEISLLTWKHVNIERRTAYLPRTKNGDERTVPLSPDAIAILQMAKINSDRQNVFGMSKDAITKAMQETRNRAGIHNLTFHDLRHEATSRLFENTDLDVMEIKTITGHRSLQMLARYSHLRTHRLADRLAGARRGEPLETKEEAPKKRGRPCKQAAD